MIRPGKFPLNIPAAQQWGERVLDYVEENRPISGLGTQVGQGAGGRNVNVTGGGGPQFFGPRLHNIPGLAGHIPDPIGIVGDVIEEVTGSISIPDPTTLISNLSGAFGTVLNGGSIPSQATVQGWVDAYIGTTLDTIIGDIPAAIAAKLAALVSGVPATLEAFFAQPSGPIPGNGDKIYTASAGICYELWQQFDGIPVSNSIFAVPFTVTIDEDEQTWVALTTFPAPNISSLVESVTALVMAGINSTMSLASHLLVAAIMALFNLTAAIMPLIEDLIEAALVFVWAAIDSLETALEALTDRVVTIEGLLENITTIDAIDTAGFARTITVLDATAGSDIRVAREFVDPATGGTFDLKFIFWDESSPGGDTDFKLMYWLGQDGVHWAANVLMKTSDGYPKVEDSPTGELYNPIEVVTCDNGEITILKKDDA